MKNHEHLNAAATIAVPILFLLFLLFIFINLTSSSAASQLAPDKSAPRDEIPASYLACYALDEADKATCHKELAIKYIKSGLSTDNPYAQNFAYSAEKMGFEEFLKQNNKPCQSINEGPLYNKDLEAYEVVCTSGELYIMRFAYEQSAWNLVE